MTGTGTVKRGSPSQAFSNAGKALHGLIPQFSFVHVKFDSFSDFFYHLLDAKQEQTFDRMVNYLREGLKKPLMNGDPPLWDDPEFPERFENAVADLKSSHPAFINRKQPDALRQAWDTLVAYCKAAGIRREYMIAHGDVLVTVRALRECTPETFGLYIESIRQNAARLGIAPDKKMTVILPTYTAPPETPADEGVSNASALATLSLNDIIERLAKAHAAHRAAAKSSKAAPSP